MEEDIQRVDNSNYVSVVQTSIRHSVSEDKIALDQLDGQLDKLEETKATLLENRKSILDRLQTAVSVGVTGASAVIDEANNG